MRHANLSCPQEMVEVDGLWQYRPVLPGYEINPMKTVEVRVEVLGIDGEKAWILPPKKMRQNQQEIVEISTQYLN
jgi:hypothetical protein